MWLFLIAHSWSVHLLIDLLAADSVIELSNGDYCEQTCLFISSLTFLFADPSKISKQIKLCGAEITDLNQDLISSGARIMGCYHCSVHSPVLTLLMVSDSFSQQPTTISHFQSKQLRVPKTLWICFVQLLWDYIASGCFFSRCKKLH